MKIKKDEELISDNEKLISNLEQKKLSEGDKGEILKLEEESMDTDTTYPLTFDELEDLFDQKNYIIYGYYLKNDLIAKVGFTLLDNEKKEAELDISVLPELQGKGIGGYIFKKSIKDFLKEYPDRRVFLLVHPENFAKRLYEKYFEEVKKIDTDHGTRIVMNINPDFYIK